MTLETRLWLVRHAPVMGVHGVLHDLQAPADIGDDAALSRLRAQLPGGHSAVTSAARRAQETALALGLRPRVEPALNERRDRIITGVVTLAPVVCEAAGGL